MTGVMGDKREFHTATLLRDGKVLVAGGSGDKAPTLLSTAELYDPATGLWNGVGATNAGRLMHTATLLPDGKVLVAGGYGIEDGSNNSLSSAELFDPVTGTWQTTGPLNGRRSNHTATLLPNGKVLIAGGYDFNDALSTAELYDPATETWTPTSPLPTAPGVGSATLLPNAKVLVVKGFAPKDPGPGYDPVGQLCDPDTGHWTVTPPPTVGGQYHSETLLADGKILVAGGYAPGAVYLVDAELYDPLTGVWSNTAPLLAARKNHTATRLANGNVLIAGGYQDNCTVLSSAELYTSTNGPVAPIILTNATRSADGSFQFTFDSLPGGLFRVLTTTNPSLPLNQWTAADGLREMPPGRYQFTDHSAANSPMRFYRVTLRQ